MSYTNPILTAGVASNQSIFETVTDARHPVGTRGCLSDGSVFHYSENSGGGGTPAILAAGKLTKTLESSVDFDQVALSTGAVGDTTITVTPVGTAVYVANELMGGVLTISEGTTGAGTMYRIAGNPATTAATVFTLTLEEPIRVIINADALGTVTHNPWSDCVIADGDETRVANGIPRVAVPLASYAAPVYFWNQTWGQANCLIQGTPAIGSALQAGTAAGAAGIGDGAADFIGTPMYTGVDGKYIPIFLKIAP
jgi:hypothetical protein